MTVALTGSPIEFVPVAEVHCNRCGERLPVSVDPALPVAEALAEAERQSAELHPACSTARTVHVVSTGLRCNRRPCLESVAKQVGALVEHHWVDAGDQDPPKTCTENLVDLISPLPPESIVVWLDLDDRLVRPDALQIVQQRHDAGFWVTYGSFVHKDGRPGFAAPYGEGESVRTSPWRATHLKSFRAGLFHRIKPEHLKHEGEWLHRAVDMALMFPILEMAGYDRCAFIPDVLAEYNLGASFEFNATRDEIAIEKSRDNYVRGLPSYERVESL